MFVFPCVKERVDDGFGDWGVDEKRVLVCCLWTFVYGWIRSFLLAKEGLNAYYGMYGKEGLYDIMQRQWH